MEEKRIGGGKGTSKLKLRGGMKSDSVRSKRRANVGMCKRKKERKLKKSRKEIGKGNKKKLAFATPYTPTR